MADNAPVRITGEEIRRQVAERYPEARAVDLEPPVVDRSGWWVFALLPLFGAIGSVATGEYVQALLLVAVAALWAGVPERVTFAVATLGCVGLGAWYLLDELADPSSSVWRAFHLGLGATLLLAPVIAYQRRRSA
jgi:hypothetical protein